MVEKRVERRSRVSILRDILKTVNEKVKAKPTHILYGANLSHDRLKKYLDLLEADGFIRKVEKDEGQIFYQITEKGLEFLSGYNKMKKFFDAFGFSV